MPAIRRVNPLERAKREREQWRCFVRRVIAHWPDIAHPGIKVVLVCRVSRSQQAKRRNLDNQERAMRMAVAAAGGEVVAVFGNDKDYSGWSSDEWLAVMEEAASVARRQGAVLLACRLNRFKRSWGYDPTHRLTGKLQADERELEDLLEAVDGVQPATLLDPTASPGQERRHEIKHGQAAKGKKGGRPPSKAKRNRVAREMRRQGESIGTIAKRFNVTRSTAQYWLRGVDKGVRKRDAGQNQQPGHLSR